jgi:hypothetical protein
MIFQKSQPAETGHECLLLCLDGPTEKYGYIALLSKSVRPRNTRKSWQHAEYLRTALTRKTILL